ncbi:MAG: M1 family metallopeptidase [Thauera sp.]
MRGRDPESVVIGLTRGLLRWLASWLVVIGTAHAAEGFQPDLDLELALDPASRRLEVRAELRPQEGDFQFFLHESLQPEKAEADGRALRLRAAGSRGPWRAWQVEVPEGATLVVHYGGTLPALERERDHRGVLQALPPMASSEGSYLPSGAGWYPRPAELFTYRVALRVAQGQPALVAGRLEEELRPRAADEPYRARFVFERPTDGIDLMAGPLVVRERLAAQADGRPLRLRTYFPAALDAVAGLADNYLTDSQRYIERYSALIGDYPFTEFSVVASPLPTGFGMPTLTYIGEQVLRLPFIRATSLGHEVLHNWWGNGVMVDYARGNWSEGLTTFMADYAYKEDASPAAAREMRLGWLRDFASIPAEQQRALGEFRSRTHGAAAAVGYGKAAMVFLMLRDTIGEEAFARGIRLFWETQRFRIAGWPELQAAFEQASGRPLGGFFAQWLSLPGGPEVRLERARWVADAAVGKRADEVAGAEHGRLKLTLAQSAPVHALRVPLQLSYGERSETHWVDFDRARGEVELALDFAPAEVRLDPELRLWRRPEAAQLPPILRQWIVARTPRLVIAPEGLPAAGQAGRSGASKSADPTLAAAADALAERLFERPVRRVGEEALSRGDDPVLLVGTAPAVAGVLARAGLETEPDELLGGGNAGTARVWTVQRLDRPPLAVIAVQDAGALQALLRPLPHYGSQSWLVFDGSQVLARGVWEASGRAVAVDR